MKGRDTMERTPGAKREAKAQRKLQKAERNRLLQEKVVQDLRMLVAKVNRPVATNEATPHAGNLER
jgi:hypothetical protein